MNEIKVYVRDNDGVLEVTTDQTVPVTIYRVGNLDSVGEGEDCATSKDGDELYARTEYQTAPDRDLISYIEGIDKRCQYCGRIDSDEELKTVGGYQILSGCKDCEDDITK